MTYKMGSLCCSDWKKVVNPEVKRPSGNPDGRGRTRLRGMDDKHGLSSSSMNTDYNSNNLQLMKTRMCYFRFLTDIIEEYRTYEVSTIRELRIIRNLL